MTDFFTSDTHWGHENIRKYCPGRPGSSTQDMNEILINNWNSVVKPQDNVYHNGDFMMGHSSHWEGILNRLNGFIHMIKGNHDHKFVKQSYVQSRMIWIKDDYILNVRDASGNSQRIVLHHFPKYVWEDGHKGVWHFHGHCHGSIDEVNRETTRLDIGVDAEYSAYKPMSFAQVKEIMDKKKYRIVDHHNEEKR